MKSVVIVVVLLVFTAVAGAAQQQAPENSEDVAVQTRELRVKSMQQRAAAAKPEDAGKAYAELMGEEIELANDYFTAGQVEKAHAMVKDAVAAADKARDVTLKHPKHLKQVEILIRQGARRLNDVRRSLALEDRPHVGRAVKDLESVSRDLMDAMFGNKGGA